MRADAREAIDHRAAAVKTVAARYFFVFSVCSVCSVVGHIPESEWRTTEYTDYTECTSQEKLDTEINILDKV